MSDGDHTNDLVSRMTDVIREMSTVVVAFSGGVDSSVVAAIAHRALGPEALAVTAVSPALATGELSNAREVAARIGIRHQTLTTNELDDENYRKNSRDRCFFCKQQLYFQLHQVAAHHGPGLVLSGANVDDLGDWRPGLRAAEEALVRHPLVEIGATKAEVRAMARALQLPNAEKVASPCLASRIPYGTEVSIDTLSMIDRAEHALRILGYREFRVRHYGVLGKVELSERDQERASNSSERRRIDAAVRGAGYERSAISRTAFKSGSLNALPIGLPE